MKNNFIILSILTFLILSCASSKSGKSRTIASENGTAIKDAQTLIAGHLYKEKEDVLKFIFDHSGIYPDTFEVKNITLNDDKESYSLQIVVSKKFPSGPRTAIFQYTDVYAFPELDDVIFNVYSQFKAVAIKQMKEWNHQEVLAPIMDKVVGAQNYSSGASLGNRASFWLQGSGFVVQAQGNSNLDYFWARPSWSSEQILDGSDDNYFTMKGNVTIFGFDSKTPADVINWSSNAIIEIGKVSLVSSIKKTGNNKNNLELDKIVVDLVGYNEGTIFPVSKDFDMFLGRSLYIGIATLLGSNNVTLHQSSGLTVGVLYNKSISGSVSAKVDSFKPFDKDTADGALDLKFDLSYLFSNNNRNKKQELASIGATGGYTWNFINSNKRNIQDLKNGYNFSIYLKIIP